MPKIDQFESVFKSADKEVFSFEKVEVDSALLVTDLNQEEAATFSEQVKGYLSVLGNVNWTIVTGEQYGNVEDLLKLVEDSGPDLVCTYRNLHSAAWKFPHSVGEYVDVLTQVAKPSILLLPHPEAGRAAGHSMEDTNVVMAITDHLTGDNRLINHAVRYTEADGKLFLTHIEDEATFEYYMDLISKIPNIDTEIARAEIQERAQRGPADYIRSCTGILKEKGITVHVEAEVTHGHHLMDYKNLIEDHKIDLLVLNTKDDEQLAMHGMAYPLAVEIRDIPLLML
jgi:hypothetical protein